MVACDAYVCAWNAFFFKSRLIPGDEATASNGKGVKEGKRQGKREKGEVMVVLLRQGGQ